MNAVSARAPARDLVRLAVIVVTAGALAGCSWFQRNENKRKLAGERISVMTLENQLEKDPSLAGTPVTLPPATSNVDWPQPGGTPSGDLGHVALGNQLRTAWVAEVGEGKAGASRILTPPIVAGGRVYAMDAQSTVTALNAGNGAKVWSRNFTPKKEDKEAGYGGGVAFDGGRIFVTSGFGFVVALDPGSGKEIWRRSIGVPLRAAPVAANGQVFVLTEDNQVYALAQADGRENWTYQGIVEPARLLGSPSVAVDQDTVIVPFSSGELFALRAENGGMVWSDSLTRTGPQTSLSILSDIAGRPSIDRGLVYAVSHSGRMAAIDIRTGERTWAVTLAGSQPPWAGGDFVYVITLDSELACITRAEGKIKWVAPLQRFKKPKDKKDPIEWSGPVLAGNRLIAVSSAGQLVSVSPQDGKVLGSVPLPEGSLVPPTVAGNTVYVLTGDAKLVALR